jgi:hypothetical protein
MKNTAIGILFVGILITLFVGCNFVTQEKIVEIGQLEITKKKSHIMEWSSAVGVVVMLIGGGLLFYSGKKAS